MDQRCQLRKSAGISLVLVTQLLAAAFAQVPASGVTISAAAGGVRRYTPGKWSSVSVQGVNQSETEAFPTVAVYFGKDVEHQYARRMWVPPRSRRLTWLPILAPSKVESEKWSFDMTTLAILESSGGEMIKRRTGQDLLPNVPILADREAVKTAAIFRRAFPDGRGYVADLDNDAYELMATARQLSDLSRVIITLSDDFSPPHPVMWESLHQFILCGDRIMEDSAGLAVLRDWLFRGGRLCVFLDRTSPETVAAILGHGDTFRIVDRVELDEFTIEDTWQTGTGAISDRRRFETPVELVRVIAEGVDVHTRVNGWPAAFWKPAGNGEVLFITLAPDGWRPSQIRPGDEGLAENNDAKFRGQAALQSVASRFFQPRPAEPKLLTGLQSLLQEKIGYRIPDRRVATGLLGLNVLGLVLGGMWLARRNKLDRMAILLPILAGATTIAFLVIGSLNSRSVPSSLAFAELVQYMPESDSAHISGLAAMYQQRTQEMQVAGGQDGILIPLAKPVDGSTHRLLWGDEDSGRWVNVTVPAGSVQFASFDQRVQLAEPVTATGQFQAEGFVGKLPASFGSDIADALVASLPAPSMAIQLRSDGTFTGRTEDVFARDQYLAGAVVSDESRRRLEVYRSLLTTSDVPGFATRPTLMAWTAALPALNVTGELHQQGMALAALPLSIERTPPATEFAVPATFIRVESVLGTKGRSLAYNDRNGRWISNASRATSSRLRFVLPKQVLPCKLSDARLTIKLGAPSRELIVSSVIDNREEQIQRIPNPNGVFHIDVNRPEWLSVDEGGGLKLTIEITEAEQERLQREQNESRYTPANAPSPPAQLGPGGAPIGAQGGASSDLPQSFETWEVDYVRLDARGKTL